MVTITHKAEDISAQASSSGTNIKRIMRVSADSVAEAVASSKIPQRGSRHPYNSMYALTERNIEIVGNLNRQVQLRIDLTYSHGSGGETSTENPDTEGGYSRPPWKTGARNVQVSYSTESVPLLQGFNHSGDEFQLLNSAGSRFKVETNLYLRRVTFNFSVRAGQDGNPPVNNTPLINASGEKVAGFTFAPKQAMLLPMNATFVQDVDDTGHVYRKYWDVTAEILENPNTWERELLNIGTFARFGDKKEPQQIYQYTPWTNPDPILNQGIQPKYGSIEDVIAAREVYRKSFTEKDSASAMQNFPFQEVTEPLPLRADGTIYEEAMLDPVNHPYLKIGYYEYLPTYWRSWNLPKERA